MASKLAEVILPREKWNLFCGTFSLHLIEAGEESAHTASTVIFRLPYFPLQTTPTVTVTFNTFNNFYSDFKGWSNWLIMALYLTSQFIPMLHSLAKASHGIAFRRLVKLIAFSSGETESAAIFEHFPGFNKFTICRILKPLAPELFGLSYRRNWHAPWMRSKPEHTIWSRDTGQQIPCFDSCQLTTMWILEIKKKLHVW